MDSTDKIKLYRSLFRGRHDIFARRWDKTGGYFPEELNHGSLSAISYN